MTPARREPGPRYRSGLRQVWWLSVPIWSIGFLSFVPFLAYALIRRRKQDWAVFAAYLAATVAMIVALAASDSAGGASAAVGGLIVALAGCASAHAAVLFRPAHNQRRLAPPMAPAPVELAARDRNRTAVARARDRIELRNQARHLLTADPALARDLAIGRPDLPREYDDGGLVDVNRVPAIVLAEYLGLAPDEVRDVLAAREKLGKFVGADELCAYTDLSPDRVDELRDLMIFS